MLRWITGVLACLLLVSACADVVGPPASGVYLLREVNGDGLPASLQLTGGPEYTILSESLTFSSGGRYRRIRTMVRTDAGTQSTVDVTEEQEGAVRRHHGDWVLLSDQCLSETYFFCGQTPRVQFQGSTLVVIDPDPRLGVLLFSLSG